MPEFAYTAVDRAGKQVTGNLSGKDATDAAGKVRSMGFFPVNISDMRSGGAGRQVVSISGGKTRPNIEGATRPNEGVRKSGKKIGRVQVLLFTRQLADLIDAGLPIDRALTVLKEQTDNSAVEAMVTQLQGDIRAGKPLSEALQAYPREFPVLYGNMIHAGEVSGQLAGVMARLADFLEKEAVRRSQLMGALTYPMVLICVAISAVTFLLTFVIPKLQGVFKDLGADLPLPTQMLLGASAFIQNYWWAVILGGAGAYFGFKAWNNTYLGRRSVDGFKLKAPAIGVLNRKIVMARFVRTLGTLLAGGVPILDSLDISGSGVGNTVATDGISAVHDGVRQGETLAQALDKSGVFLPLVIHMTSVGEETGRLPQMLIRTADSLDFEVDNTMRKLTTLVEPLVVLLMGGFVGFVVLSILMPIFAANSAVK